MAASAVAVSLPHRWSSPNFAEASCINNFASSSIDSGCGQHRQKCRRKTPLRQTTPRTTQTQPGPLPCRTWAGLHDVRVFHFSHYPQLSGRACTVFVSVRSRCMSTTNLVTPLVPSPPSPSFGLFPPLIFACEALQHDNPNCSSFHTTLKPSSRALSFSYPAR